MLLQLCVVSAVLRGDVFVRRCLAVVFVRRCAAVVFVAIIFAF